MEEEIMFHLSILRLNRNRKTFLAHSKQQQETLISIFGNDVRMSGGISRTYHPLEQNKQIAATTIRRA
jgi:hypothetical protein